MELKDRLLDGLHRRRKYIISHYNRNDLNIAVFEVDTLIKVIEKYSKDVSDTPTRIVRRKKKEETKTYKRKERKKPRGLFY